MHHAHVQHVFKIQINNNKRHVVCMKHRRPPMTNTLALLNGTETAFRQSTRSRLTICMHFKKSKHLWGQGSVNANTGLDGPQKKHSLR